MNRPTISTNLQRFINMAKNPVPFDPITYKDQTDDWMDVEVSLNALRVKNIFNNTINFGDKKTPKIRTERYAVVDIQTDNESVNSILANKDWKILNRIATEEGSWSSPAFSQLCGRLNPITGLSATQFKDLIRPIRAGKDADGKTVWYDDIPEAIAILNDALAKTEDKRTLRLNPDGDKIEAIVSKGYAPVTNKEILTLLQAEVGDFSIVRELHSNRRSLFQVLPDKFANMSDSEEYGMFLENSSTGANKLGMGLFVITSMCTNGMMFTASKHGQTEYLTRRHYGKKDKIIQLIQDQCAILGERIEETYTKIELAKKTPLHLEEYTQEDVIETLLPVVAEGNNLSKKTVGRIETLLKEKYQENSIWDFVSALTDAAHEAPVDTREHIEKVAGNLLETFSYQLATA